MGGPLLVGGLGPGPPGPIPATDHVDAMDRLAACIERIRDWMADNHLKLNEEKTQIIWLGTRQQLNKVTARALTLPNATV